MIQNFRLLVDEEQEIAVVYQQPDDFVFPKPAFMVEAAKKKGPINAKRKKADPAPKTKPLVIMMHGFPGNDKNGTANVLAQFEDRLIKQAWPSIRFDFRGCGESDGQPVDFCLQGAVEDLDAVIAWGKEQGHRSFVLLGEDVGAVVAIMGYAQEYVSGLVMLWPPVIMKDTAFSAMYTPEARREADERDAPYVPYGAYRLGWSFFNEAYNTDLVPYLEKINAPVLIQHGSKDEIVPLEQAFMARDSLRFAGEVAVFEGGDHGITKPNMRDALFTNIEYFMAKALKRPEKA